VLVSLLREVYQRYAFLFGQFLVAEYLERVLAPHGGGVGLDHGDLWVGGEVFPEDVDEGGHEPGVGGLPCGGIIVVAQVRLYHDILRTSIKAELDEVE